MFLSVLMQHNGIFSLPHLKRRKLFVSWLSIYGFIRLYFSWLLYKPIQTWPLALLPLTLFCQKQSSFLVVQNWQRLCAIFHGTGMHLWKLREDTFFIVYRAKNLVVRIRAGCGMGGEGLCSCPFPLSCPAVWSVAWPCSWPCVPSGHSDGEWQWWHKLPLAFEVKYGPPLFWLAAFSFCNWNSVRLRRELIMTKATLF